MPSMTPKLMIPITLVLWMMSTSTSLLWSQPRVQTAAITFDDQNKVEHLIRTYFKAIELKDYATAWDLTSSDAKKEYPQCSFKA